MKSFRVLLLAMVLSGALPVCRAELVPAIGRDPAELDYITGVGHGGWTFYAKVPLFVTALGFYDHQSDGLFGDQLIAIWKDTSGLTTWPFINPLTSVLVMSNTVPKGTEATLLGSYRIVAFDVALKLEPGGYEIAGLDPSASELGKYLNGNDPVSPRIDPRVMLGAPAGGSGSPPGEYIAAYGAYLGPMFFIEVPEPSVASLLLAAGMLGLVRRRRR